MEAMRKKAKIMDHRGREGEGVREYNPSKNSG
jgi:hypothetical protein